VLEIFGKDIGKNILYLSTECQTIRQKPFRQKGRIRFGKIAELLPNVLTDSAKVDSATTYEIIYKTL
jgi:hypothetical protein